MPWGYPDEAWAAAAAQARDALVRHAERREVTTYGALCAEVTAIRIRPRSWGLMALLGVACAPEDEAHGIVLASLVTRKADGLPGEGYFEWARREGLDVSDRRAMWTDQVERVFAAYAGP